MSNATNSHQKKKHQQKMNQENYSMATISQYFSEPIQSAAKKLNIPVSKLRSLCRALGILRWPFKNREPIAQRFNSFDFHVPNNHSVFISSTAANTSNHNHLTTFETLTKKRITGIIAKPKKMYARFQHQATIAEAVTSYWKEQVLILDGNKTMSHEEQNHEVFEENQSSALPQTKLLPSIRELFGAHI